MQKIIIQGVLLILFSSILFLNGGCRSYVLGRGSRTMPGGIRLLAIPMFKNKSMEPGVELTFTNAMRHQISQSQVARIVSVGQADAYLEGTIDSVTHSGSNIVKADKSNNHLPEGTVLNSMESVSVTASLKLRRASDGYELWSGSVSTNRSYTAPMVTFPVLNSVNPLYGLSARRQNIESISLQLMAEAHDRMTENF